MKKFQSDYLIIGSGLAGLFSAYHASQYGTVALITKHDLKTSSSFWAQGGIAAAIDKTDSTQNHVEDTLEAGRNLCDKKAVEILVNEGITRIEELIKSGMKFDLLNGEIALGLEGGHSRRRVLHAGGTSTGEKIVNFVLSMIKGNKNVTVFENTLIHDLICEDQVCAGARGFKWDEKEDYLFGSKNIFLASGGASGIYFRTTNPHSSTGDGVSLAYNAGAEIRNMEFIQFHPTAFYSKSGETFLISEAARGDGAYLVNHKDERFMIGKHELAELAPRDVVSKAIFSEMLRSNLDCVYLKLDHIDGDYIKSRFPNIFDEALKHDLDIRKDKIPISPAAHYMVGGIKTDLNARTNVKNLYAFGEVASSGVHGANRLASNSLLECLVFGYRAVQESINEGNKIEIGVKEEGSYSVNQLVENDYLRLKNIISRIMNRNVGIVRNEELLKEALLKLSEIETSWNFEEYEYYSDRLSSLLVTSKMIINGALTRKESRGGHIREDYNGTDKQPYNLVQKKNREIQTEVIN
ncbi:MAG: L-aspartate oxidase [Melioribacteraceae bacterium]|nr:L-aspartate oxidase [Melioribacteraceae bacterium]